MFECPQKNLQEIISNFPLVDLFDTRNVINTYSYMPVLWYTPKFPYIIVQSIKYFSCALLCYWPEQVTQHSQTRNFKRITLVFQVCIFFSVPDELFQNMRRSGHEPVHQKSHFLGALCCSPSRTDVMVFIFP